jgi:hypothetical protein
LAGGTIDVKLIPRDRLGRAYTAGMLDDKLYLIDTRAGQATSVFDFATIAPGGWPQLIRMTRDGTRLFITMNVAGRVAMLDTSDPEHPLLLSTLDLGPQSRPHYLTLTRDERRLVVSDYHLALSRYISVEPKHIRATPTLLLTARVISSHAYDHGSWSLRAAATPDEE